MNNKKKIVNKNICGALCPTYAIKLHLLCNMKGDSIYSKKSKMLSLFADLIFADVTEVH